MLPWLRLVGVEDVILAAWEKNQLNYISINNVENNDSSI